MALTDASAAFSASAPDGASILKDIAPGSPLAATSKVPATGRLPLRLALGIPSPARAGARKNFQGAAQPKNMPFGPPAHSPAPLAQPLVPPPPQFLPAPACQEQQPPTMTMLDPSSTSYRERLRAGGRGAFQRALDAGLAPKAMKQDQWSGLQAPSAPAQGFLPKQLDCQTAATMQYSTTGDGQQIWNGMQGQMQSNGGWCSPMNQPQMQSQQPYMQQQMMSQSMPQQMPPQIFQEQVQLMQGGESPHLAQMVAPQMQAHLNGCMANVMPLAGTQDQEFMALQLKAAAELNQCYQD